MLFQQFDHSTVIGCPHALRARDALVVALANADPPNVREALEMVESYPFGIPSPGAFFSVVRACCDVGMLGSASRVYAASVDHGRATLAPTLHDAGTTARLDVRGTPCKFALCVIDHAVKELSAAQRAQDGNFWQRMGLAFGSESGTAASGSGLLQQLHIIVGPASEHRARHAQLSKEEVLQRLDAGLYAETFVTRGEGGEIVIAVRDEQPNLLQLDTWLSSLDSTIESLQSACTVHDVAAHNDDKGRQ